MKKKIPEGAKVCVRNRMLMRDMRVQKEWTQSELARAAGLSLRVIAKAEAGEAISRETIDIIARTLSTEPQTISADDLISCPLHVVRKFTETFYTTSDGQLPELSHWLHDNVEFEIVGDVKKLRFAGKFRGPADVLRFWKLFFEEVSVPSTWRPLDHLQFIPQHFEVAVWGKRSLIHRQSQVAFDPFHSQFYRFRDGKICSMVEIFDTARFADLTGS